MHTHLPKIIVSAPSGLLRRLTLFRRENEDDSTVLNYFDELEIHPEHIGTAHTPSHSGPACGDVIMSSLWSE